MSTARACIGMGYEIVPLEWESDTLDDTPGLDLAGGAAHLISEDGIASYPLQSDGDEPAWNDGVRKVWAKDGFLHRVTGPAMIEKDENDEWWIFGCPVDQETFNTHLDRIKLLDKFVNAKGYGWREFDGAFGRVMNFDVNSGFSLIDALRDGKITIRTGPRGFEEDEVVDFTKVEAASSISGVHVAAGAVGLMGLLALASKSKISVKREELKAQEVLK